MGKFYVETAKEELIIKSTNDRADYDDSLISHKYRIVQ